MGLKKFIKEIGKSKFEKISDFLFNQINPILEKDGFEFQEKRVLIKNESSFLIWQIYNSEKFFQMSLFRMSSYFRWHEQIPKSTPDYQLQFKIGEGGHSLEEAEWSSLTLNKLNSNLNDKFRFNSKMELANSFDSIRKDIKESLFIFKEQPNIFYEKRKQQAEEQIPSFWTEFDEEINDYKVTTNVEQLKFKEKYSK